MFVAVRRSPDQRPHLRHQVGDLRRAVAHGARYTTTGRVPPGCRPGAADEVRGRLQPTVASVRQRGHAGDLVRLAGSFGSRVIDGFDWTEVSIAMSRKHTPPGSLGCRMGDITSVPLDRAADGRPSVSEFGEKSLLLHPVAALGYATVLLGEMPSLAQLGGVALVIGCVAAVSSVERSAARSVPVLEAA